MANKAQRNLNLSFWLLAISLIIVLTLPVLIQDGMFMDAVLYTSVSHNLSQGVGTFWFPQFSLHNISGMRAFHEQPPLVFGIQSIFYRIFGESMYVERFYTFLTLCCNTVLIVLLWKEINKNRGNVKKLGWLPLILWIIIPVCFWSFSNNMHENTMSVFTLSAALCVYKTFSQKYFSLSFNILSGVFIFLATFSKGIPGFFPITMPILYWLVNRNFGLKKALAQSLFITAIPVSAYAVLLLLPESSGSLTTYFFERVLHRINSVPTVDSHFYILFRLIIELLPPLLITGAVLLFEKVSTKKTISTINLREGFFFIFVGLAASVPLMLTLVQKGFYFVPALPFFALGLSSFTGPFLSDRIDRIQLQNRSFRWFLFISVFIFISATGFAVLQKGKTSRNQAMLHDVYLIGKIVPKKSTIDILPEMWNYWDLQCYLMRYFTISCDTKDQNVFFINDKTLGLKIPEHYEKVPIKTFQFDLYKNKTKRFKKTETN